MGIKFERNFLRADELLQRWQCSEADLKYEVIESNLSPIIFVNEADAVTDRDGKPVFWQSECYKLKSEDDDVLAPGYANYGYLILETPIRESIKTCSFLTFAAYKTEPGYENTFWTLGNSIPLEKYWDEIVFDLPSVLSFETARTKGAKLESIEHKPLTTRERDTLLTIIAALCKEAKLDYTKHSKTAGLIQSTAATMGLSIGETTIEGHLKKIPDALATRMK